MPELPPLQARLTEANTHIDDSVRIRRRKDIAAYLIKLREESPSDMAINHRSLHSLVCEWRAHNFFYDLHVFRSRTKDVDLEYPKHWLREIFCRVVSFFYFW